VRLSVVLASAAASLGLVALASVALGLSFERAVLLAPVIVLSAGAVVALVVIWSRAARDTLRRR
jgi:hypothetical protein